VFGDAPLITGQHHTSFTIARSLMQLPGPGCNTAAAAGKSSQLAVCRSMPADFRASAEQLVLSLLIEGCPGIETAAEAAGTSTRTLQRRLAESGLTYSGLVAAGRLRLARTWLAESDLPVAEIAASLGYNEASNFARAFRRQTGLSPAAYRRIRKQA
jgi:AraC-like DNA-binding protein